MSDDPICVVCQERRSAHVPTEDGPLTCPRLARKEGRYVLVSPGYIMSGCMGSGPGAPDEYVNPTYRFEPYSSSDKLDQLNQELERLSQEIACCPDAHGGSDF